jgi:hypothetical protein
MFGESAWLQCWIVDRRDFEIVIWVFRASHTDKFLDIIPNILIL